MFVYLDIVGDFSCEMCGRCCRNDWQITLSEESYLRNEQLFRSTGRGKEFSEAFITLGKSAGLEEYAYISKHPDGSCWFLAKENYCLLHREAGHSHLDAVCQLFPRLPMSTARGQELTLSFSCPAVLKLASRKAPLAVIRAEEPPLEFLAGQFVAHVYPQQQKADNPLRFYFELEQHFIDIMQFRGLLIKERLLLLTKTVDEIRQLASTDLRAGLTAVFYKNYEYFDNQAAHIDERDTEILLEHFFVNLIFKKVFYIYGFQGAINLLSKAARYIEMVRAEAGDNEADLAAVTKGIMAMEFQYGHNRQALLEL